MRCAWGYISNLPIQSQCAASTFFQHFLIKILLCLLYTHSLYADSNNPCSDIINIVDSPSHMDSLCTTPFRKVFFEFNYVDQQLNGHAGVQQNYPNAAIRIGLPYSNEFFVNPPNYIAQKNAPKSGSTPITFGAKHSIYYNSKWLFAFKASVNPPSGSYAHGSEGWGATFSGIANYTINDQFSLSGMLRINRLSDSKLSGEGYYNSYTPDLLLSFSPNDKVSIYGEVYGQSKISPSQGAGFNFDAGALFLITPNTIFDISAGQQIYNYFGDFKHYINLGVSVML